VRRRGGAGRLPRFAGAAKCDRPSPGIGAPEGKAPESEYFATIFHGSIKSSVALFDSLACPAAPQSGDFGNLMIFLGGRGAEAAIIWN
jgi:hypothetical protein